MKTIKKITLALAAFLMAVNVFAQDKRHLDNYRSPDKDGVNVFEAPKDTISTFDGVKVRMGGASALQYQSLNHENSGDVDLIKIGDNFNLATANLDIDVAIAKGVRMHLRTYLSSRHHPEAWVKGGYLQVDNLDFVSEGLLADLMKNITLKFGHMEVNYGDNHFRRTDNAQGMFNPFVGNYIMDSFTTEVGGELYYQKDGFLVMIGLTNGKLNQNVTNPGTTSPSLVGKLGYDKQINDDLRLRFTGSVYSTAHTANSFLYSGDRSGSRYYLVMEGVDADPSAQFSSGRFNPGLRNQTTAVMFNPFVKYKGLEFYGAYERAEGRAASESDNRDFSQYIAEVLYRFGNKEQFYFGGRYNYVTGEQIGTGNDIDITRYQLGGGWFLTKNVLTKIEYVNQTYDGFPTGDRFDDGQFDGLMVEAIISF